MTMRLMHHTLFGVLPFFDYCDISPQTFMYKFLLEHLVSMLLGGVPRSGIAESHGNSVFKVLRKAMPCSVPTNNLLEFFYHHT